MPLSNALSLFAGVQKSIHALSVAPTRAGEYTSQGVQYLKDLTKWRLLVSLFSLSYEIRLYFQPGFKLSYMNTQKALPLLSVRCTSGLFIIQFIGYSSTEIWWARTCPQYICNIFCSQFAFGKTKKNTEMLKSTKFMTLSFI